MLFEQFKLHMNLLRGIHASGYMLPTPLQQEFVPAAMGGKDVLACAYAGSGKTAAFVLPALQRLIKKGLPFSKGPRVIILAPSRNAVLQAGKLLKQIGKFMRFRMTLLAENLGNGQYQDIQSEQIIDILVATPERLLSYISNGKIELSRLELLIYDEAQRLDVESMMQISRTLPRHKQTLVIVSELDEDMQRIANRLLQKPSVITVEDGHTSGRSLRHYLYACDDEDHKNDILKNLLEQRTHVCVLTRDIDKAQELYDFLQGADVTVALLSDDLQLKRQQLRAFAEGAITAVIASNDSQLRGVDLKDVQTLVHYESPQYPEHYLQRVAPLAQNKNNSVVVLATAEDASHVNSIEHLMGYHFTPRTIEGLEPQLPFYRPKIKLKRDHLGRIVRRAQFNNQDGRRPVKRNSKQKSGHLRMLRRMPKQQKDHE